jgi:protein-tyrosine phosphatase
MPYRIGAWINARLWTRREPATVRVASGVLLGRMPTTREARQLGITHLVDLSAELSSPRGVDVRAVPMLDLIAPDAERLRVAADAIETQRLAAGDTGTVLVCCALGYSRSAAAVAAWLLHTGRAERVDEAIERLRRERPNLVLYDAHRLALASLALHP